MLQVYKNQNMGQAQLDAPQMRQISTDGVAGLMPTDNIAMGRKAMGAIFDAMAERQRVQDNTDLAAASSELQKQAILAAAEQRIMILTGGPGTGKTTTINTIIRILQHSEQTHLSLQIFLSGNRQGVHHALVHRQELASVVAEAVHGTALDEVFHGALVELALPHPGQEVLQ